MSLFIKKIRQPHVILLSLILLLAALTRFIYLGDPPQEVFDEVYYIPAARELLLGQDVRAEPSHPPVSKLLIASSMYIFGDHPAAWRFPGAVAGVLAVLMAYLLAHRLFKNPWIGILAAALLALDGLPLVESRTAKPEIFLLLFFLATLWAFWSYLSTKRPYWLYLTGLFGGLAAGTKWTGSGALATVFIFLFLDRWGRWGMLPPKTAVRSLSLGLIAVPLAVYLASWWQYFAVGHDFVDFLREHEGMYRYHAELSATHPYQSPWWSWPLLLRPIWYFWENLAPGLVKGIVAIGNPAIWWATVLGFLAALIWARKKKDRPLLFLVLGVAVNFLPFALINRVLFLYHYLPAFSLLAILLSVMLVYLFDRPLRRILVAAYLIVLGLLFTAFYPLWAGRPISEEWYRRLMWFERWI